MAEESAPVTAEEVTIGTERTTSDVGKESVETKTEDATRQLEPPTSSIPAPVSPPMPKRPPPSTPKSPSSKRAETQWLQGSASSPPKSANSPKSRRSMQLGKTHHMSFLNVFSAVPQKKLALSRAWQDGEGDSNEPQSNDYHELELVVDPTALPPLALRPVSPRGASSARPNAPSISFELPALRRSFSEPFFNSWEFYPFVAIKKKDAPAATAESEATEKQEVGETVSINEGIRTETAPTEVELTPEIPQPRERRDSVARRALITKDVNGKQIITAGEIEQLISCLAPEDVLDPEYIDDFLISYRYFLTPTQLMQHLVSRYEYLPTGQETEEEVKRRQQWEGPIRLRVINILRNWLNKHYYDFKNTELTNQLLDFVDRIISVNNKKWADQLHLTLQEHVESVVKGVLSRDSALPVIKAAMKKEEADLLHKYKKDPTKRCFNAGKAITWLVTNLNLIHRIEGVAIGNRMLQSGLICHVSRPKTVVFSDNEEDFYFFVRQTNEPEEEVYPKPLTDKSLLRSASTSFVLTDQHPMEVARQLTLAEFALFKAITPTEIKSQAWNKKNWQEVSPNVYSIIQRFNRIGLWIATEIVTEQNVSKRKEVLRRCIEIADCLRKLQNWNTLFAVISGLNQSSVSRLKRTWAGLQKKTLQTFTELGEFTNPEHNFKAYREAKAAAGDVPFLPYLGLYLRDLTFIEDGNPDELENGMINFEKMRMISKVFAEIQRYQMGKRFVFKRLAPLQEWLDNGFVMQEKELYDISVKNEAREEGGSIRAPNSVQHLTPTDRPSLSKSRSKKFRTAVQGLF